ncbi:response regulator [Longibacter salinarum]|uniref:Response regulator n=1 Tax=Longibacter salinarum TaxID=1850348 RepID=A0A2A8CW33_9BACT|nr:response regulator transcription factor [Longibacter salinarum]PEN12915.1 response regulator [Longibacter salinarum]
MTATVFLVEDQTLMRESMQAYLNAEDDLEVSGVAGRAEDVLDRIGDDVPDLFLIDVALPGMSGIDLLRRLRQRHPDARYLMLSGHVEQTYVEAAHNAGASGYVMKGKPDEYLDAIRQILAGKTYRSDTVASMWDQAATTS